MKAHEETWERTECGEDYCNEVLNGSSTEVFLGNGPRLQLAAAAPEMARLLLETQYAAGSSDQPSECISCGAMQVVEGTHEPNCKLVAVLRKAGVL